jgi:PhoPQ-activated pathogenicity-related protein
VGDKAWTSTPLTADANGEYTGTVETPGAGWRAYLVELTFDVPGNADLKFTSPVRITPDTLPFKYVPNPNPEPGYLSAK